MMASLGQAILEVRIDENGLTSGLKRAEQTATQSLKAVENTGNQTAARAAKTWRDFTSANYAEFRKLESSHAATMQRLSREWTAYKTAGVTANQQVAQAAQTAAAASDRAVRGTTASLGGVTRAFDGFASRISTIFAGGLIAGGVGMLANQLQGFASEADKAEKAAGAYSRALARFGQDVNAGQTQVQRLSERFGVLDTTVQQASTTLIRNGASLADVEKALTAAGASAAAQGTSIEQAFNNVSIALATGRSELLESSGIITNLGPVYQAFAKSVNKTVEELTQAEKIQAGVAAIFKESRFEVEEIDNAMAGYAGTQAEANRAAAETRREFGEALQPAVVSVTRATTEALKATTSLIGYFREYPGVLASVTTAVVMLSAALAVNRAGGLGFLLAQVPALAARAGASIAVAFGPAGIAFAAVTALVAIVAGLFADIKRAEAELAATEAWRQRKRSEDASYRVSDDLVRARGRVADLRREIDSETRRLENANKLYAPTREIELRLKGLREELALGEKSLTAAQAAYDTQRKLNTEKAKGTKETQAQAAATKDLYSEAERLLKAYENARGGKAIAAAKKELDEFSKGSKAAQAAVAAVKEEMQRAEVATKAATRATSSLKTELENISDTKFKASLENASPARLQQLVTLYSQVTPNAERYSAVVAELERREDKLAATRKKSAEQLERERAALADYLDGRKFDAWARSLDNATDKQLANARAVALQTGNLEKLRELDAEMDRRREARIEKLKAEEGAWLKVAAAVSDKRFTDGIDATIAAVQRTAGPFQSMEDALRKLAEAGITVTAPMLDALIERFALTAEEADGVAEALTRATQAVQGLLDRQDRLRTLAGHEKYAGTGTGPPPSEPVITEQQAKDLMAVASNPAYDKFDLALDGAMLAIEALDAADIEGQRAAIPMLEAILGGDNAQYFKDWARELLERANKAVAEEAARQSAAGAVAYAGLGTSPPATLLSTEELDRLDALDTIEGHLRYAGTGSRAPVTLIPEEELARLERIDTALGHINYAGLGQIPVWALAADDALQKMADGLAEVAGEAGTELPLAFSELEKSLLAIGARDLTALNPFTVEGNAALEQAKADAKTLEDILAGDGDQAVKDWAGELLAPLQEALRIAEALGWVEGSTRYGGTGRVFNRPLEPMADVEARENARTAEMGARYAGTGQVYNPPLVALASLEDLRRGYELSTVALDEYARALEVEIGILEESGDTSVATKNKIAELRAELKNLNEADLLKTFSLIEDLGGQIGGLGSAFSEAFGEDFDIAGRVLGAFGQITAAVPGMIQTFQVLASGIGTAMNLALGWIGLVLQAITLVLNLVGAFRPKQVEEEAPRIDTRAGFAFGEQDTGKAPSIALNAPSAPGFSLGAGQIQAANVQLQAAQVFGAHVAAFGQWVAALPKGATTGTNALAFGV
jgi:hypothetical protein